MIEKLLASEFPGRDELRLQLDSITAVEIDDDGSLSLQGGSASPSSLKYLWPPEGECRDEDGVMIHVLLHVKSGTLHELEVFKDDSSNVCRRPTAESLVIRPPV